jgi:L-malate glycosyltransferase
MLQGPFDDPSIGDVVEGCDLRIPNRVVAHQAGKKNQWCPHKFQDIRNGQVSCYAHTLRPLHIAHIDTESTWRGGQQSLHTLARGLRTLGHRQTIVCPARSALAARAQADGFAIATRCPHECDVAHAHSGRAHNQAVVATLGTSAIRVVSRHVAFAPASPLGRLVHRLKYAYTCHGIIAVSDAVRDGLTAAGIPSDKIEVIHTGVELPELSIAASHEGYVVGVLGAFTREKGHDVAIAAARLLPDVRFMLAGDGPLLAALAADAPMNVVFPGFVEDTADFFGQIDLLLVPSRSEAWGLSALEALAHGVPVIASSVQGLAEIVTAECGWLAQANDPQALASAIAAARSSMTPTYREAARRRAAIFSVDAMAHKTESFYERLLQLR